VTRPSLDQRAIDGEMLIAHQALRLALDRSKELLRDFLVQ
jgi:hypothetical protein